jgi:uncharacterized protein (DUF1800 family)
VNTRRQFGKAETRKVKRRRCERYNQRQSRKAGQWEDRRGLAGMALRMGVVQSKICCSPTQKGSIYNANQSALLILVLRRHKSSENMPRTSNILQFLVCKAH